MSHHIQASPLLAHVTKAQSKPLQAKQWYDKAFELASQQENRQYHRFLFSYAQETGDLELATTIAEAAAPRKTVGNSLRNKLAIWKYRAGDRDALQEYPYGKQTFYTAMDLGQMHVELEEYKEAETLVTGITITSENDPLDVTGLILEAIAKDLLAEGEKERALEFIDKAYDIAGKQFYTGFGIELAYLGMHGKLVENMDRLAKQAAAYRGHFARELTQSLVRELIEIKELDVALKAAKYLDDVEDRENSITNVALAYADHGDEDRAKKLISLMNSPKAKFHGQVRLASFYASQDKLDTARSMASTTNTEMKEEEEVNLNYVRSTLCTLLVKLGDYNTALSLVQETDDDYKLKILQSAVRGVTQ